MKTTLITKAYSAYGQILAEDPGVTFDWDFFPWMTTLREAVGGVMAITLVLAVALLVIGAIVWGAGRAMGSKGMQQASATGMLIVGGAAIIIGAANGAINWFSNVNIGV